MQLESYRHIIINLDMSYFVNICEVTDLSNLNDSMRFLTSSKYAHPLLNFNEINVILVLDGGSITERSTFQILCAKRLF